MAYHNRFLLERIIEIQNITTEHTAKGITQKWVYDHVIGKRYLISLDTFYKYLARNASAN